MMSKSTAHLGHYYAVILLIRPFREISMRLSRLDRFRGVSTLEMCVEYAGDAIYKLNRRGLRAR